MKYGGEKCCALNDDWRLTQDKLFTLLAGLGSSLPGVMDCVQIIGCTKNSKRNIHDVLDVTEFW